MPDTNTFDFLYEQNLIRKITNLICKRVISLTICQVQMDELSFIRDYQKKTTINDIPVNKIPTSIGWSSPMERYNRGYGGPRSNWFKSVNDKDAKKVTKYRRKRTTSHPTGNSADLALVFTAIKENMDYLVSNDDEVRRLHDALVNEFNSQLQFLGNESFKKLINDWEQNF